MFVKAARADAGMTLIEVMVVVLILGLIASAVGVSVLGQLEKAKIQTARTQIHDFSQALDLFKIDHGAYPSTAEGLDALTKETSKSKAYMKKIPTDPWDRPYLYIAPGVNDASGYDLYSYGPDGQEGGGDDVTSWGTES